LIQFFKGRDRNIPPLEDISPLDWGEDSLELGQGGGRESDHYPLSSPGST
jgi:hypothetical protein